MPYTPIVYIDLKVQLPLLKQGVTKKPKSYKRSQTGIIATISKKTNAPSDILPLPWWLGDRQTMEVTPRLGSNASRGKTVCFIHAVPK